jgi:hypothetical protein
MGNQIKAIRNRFFILIAGALLGIQGAQATTCTEMLQNEVAIRAQAKSEFVQSLKVSAYIMVPLTIIFPYWGGAFDLVEGVSTGVSAIRLRNAEKALEIYTEAWGSGGKASERLFRKFKRHYPESRASYSEFLAAIHDADVSGEGCDQGKIPNKRQIMTVLDAKELN